MKIINANPAIADISIYAIGEGLKILKPKDMNKVVILISNNYKSSSFDLNTIKILKKIDTSPILEDDSWMLIDYDSQTMYYSKGA